MASTVCALRPRRGSAASVRVRPKPRCLPRYDSPTAGAHGSRAGAGNFPKDRVVYAPSSTRCTTTPVTQPRPRRPRRSGRSGAAGAFDVLQAEAALQPGSTRHARDAGRTRRDPGSEGRGDPPRAGAAGWFPNESGVSALAGLAELKQAVGPAHAHQLIAVVQAALQDPFLPVREAGVELAGAFDLAQFRADIQTDADAPLDTQRDLAQKVLAQFKSRAMSRMNER